MSSQTTQSPEPTTGLTVEVRDLTLNYGTVAAIDQVSFTLAAGTICGLLGRNGAGKSTLLSALAGFRPPSGGSVLADGVEVFEHRQAVERIRLIRDEPDVLGFHTVRQALDFAASLAPEWDVELAARMVERFRLTPGKRIAAMSRGGRAAVGITIGLAARAPLTLFDESHLGLDAPARYAFYEELLADYLVHPRTIVVSTHLIEEAARLFEQVVIIDAGRLLLHEAADTLRSRGVSITGPAERVDQFVAGMTVLGEQRLGGTKLVTVYGGLDAAGRARAQAAGLELAPVPLQDLFVHLTTREEAIP